MRLPRAGFEEPPGLELGHSAMSRRSSARVSRMSSRNVSEAGMPEITVTSATVAWKNLCRKAAAGPALRTGPAAWFSFS